MDKAMMKALQADGEKLRQLTGEDHGPLDEERLILTKIREFYKDNHNIVTVFEIFGRRCEKAELEVSRLWGALEVIAGFGSVPLTQEWPDGLRDIIRAMTDCAKRALAEGTVPEKKYIIPTSCWVPREGTGIPADAQMYPPGCPDAEFCRGNRCCNWDCKAGPDDDF